MFNGKRVMQVIGRGSIEVANESEGNDDNNDYKNRVGNRTDGVVNMDDSSGATAENNGQLGR